MAERFIRTLKEQVIYGRVFQNLEELREAVRRFIDIYNRDWLVEKNGFKSPWLARADWLAQNVQGRLKKVVSNKPGAVHYVLFFTLSTYFS